MNFFLKVLLSALLIGGIAEISRRSSTLAGMLAALPLISVISMVWIYHDTHDVRAIASFSWSVFWYVIPSLILFVLLPVLLVRFQFSFYLALFLSCAATAAGFALLRTVLAKSGLNL